MKTSSEAQTDFNIEALISRCVGMIASGADFATYRNQMDQIGASLLAPMLPDSSEADTTRTLANVMARAVWKHCPHPAHRYAPAPLPTPERNSPCHCGSGRKYKHCCMTPDAGVPLDQFNFLNLLIESLPRKRWAELADSQVPLDMVLDLAMTWREEDRPEDTRDLLQPWFEGDRHWKARFEPLIDALLDAYDELGNPRMKAALLDRAMQKGDARVRSGSLQRRASMAADAGEYPLAWSLFQQAQRADPDAVSLSHLELILLLSEGREAEARERARFWLLRLQRLRDPELDGLIGFVRDIAENGGAAMVSLAREGDPALNALLECWKQAPALACLYRLKPTQESAGGLVPDKSLSAALKRWHKSFSPVDYSPLRQTDTDWWFDAEPWIRELQEHPQLWNSFEVLDGLALALGEVPLPGTFERLALPLLQRSEDLLREVLRANGAERLRFEWACHENRPALSSLATQLMYRLHKEGFVPDVIAGLEWCVLVLNPDDNLGLRQVLMRGYLHTGHLESALTLGDLYADDFAAMRYNRALALFAAGLTDEAQAVLSDALSEFPKVLKFLLAKNPRQPREEGPGIRLGGDEEAWLYRTDHLELWQRYGALEWARKASKAAKPGILVKPR